MDPPLVNESSFSAANASSYSLAEIWPYPIKGSGAGDVGLRLGNMGHGYGESSGLRDGSMEESTVTEQSGGACGRKRKDLSSEDESSKIVSTTSSANDLNDTNGKRMKTSGSKNENGGSEAKVEASSAAGNKLAESSKLSEPPKDYIHVRARRGQATDSHSLAERARREKISERMKILQDLVPGSNKVIGKSLVLDEIINYIQSLQQQVEFLSMKLESINSRVSFTPTIDGFNTKDLGAQAFDATGMIFGSQAAREYAQGLQPDWLHTQVGGSFERGR